MRRKTEPCPKCRALGNDRAGDNLVGFRDGGWHCFSCGYHVHGSGSSRMAARVEENAAPKALLPSDFTRTIPTHAFKWLLQYGLSYQYWRNHLGFSPKEDRLIFLVGTPTQFSIGRYVGPLSGKEAPRKWYAWGYPDRHCEVVNPRDFNAGDKTKSIVLVEDIVSAHKVAVAGFRSIPLFGTQLHNCHKYFLIQENCPVVLWLDKDQAGTIMRKAMGMQTLLGIPVDCLVTDNDPKALTCNEIVERLR